MVYSIQVKRLRTEDPLEALILQNSKRKRRDDEEENEENNNADLVFRLAQTNDTENKDSRVILQSYAEGSQSARKFRTTGSKRMKKEPSEPAQNMDKSAESSVAPELREMLADYIKPQLSEKPNIDPETEDYVYDVYFSEPAGPRPVSSVGYIELDEKEEKLLFDDSDSEIEDPYLLGDEDSNAEDHYGNDYPDEEDSDGSELSELDGGLGDRLGDLDLNSADWSEEEGDPDAISWERYGWR